MRRHWAYLKYVLRHKWFVFLACLEYRVPLWIAIFHDWDKFLPDEWFPYARCFYKPDGSKQYEPSLAFDAAWNLHQKRNKHHWQFWLLIPDQSRPHFTFQSHDGGMTDVTVTTLDGRDAALVWLDGLDWWKPDKNAMAQLEKDLKIVPEPLAMPDVYQREMLADWIGAGKALDKPNTWQWYEANKDKMLLHPETRAWIETELALLKRDAMFESMRKKAQGLY